MRKPRILCVTSNFPRWAGDSTTPFVLHLAQDLQKRGWAVDVLAPHASGAAKRERIGGIHVERFRYMWPDSAETICYRGGALVNLRNNRSNAIKLPALVIAEWIAVLTRLSTGKYDLLHSHWILPQGFVGALSARWLGIPHVITVHGSDVFALKGSVLRLFKRFSLGAADAVTVNSSATETAVNAIDASISSIERIPMGVSVYLPDRKADAVKAIKKKYQHGSGPLLVFLGRLVEGKGCLDLLHAIGLLRSDIPDVRALIIGDGQDRNTLEELSNHLGLSQNVYFIGWVQPSEVHNYLMAADIFVGPSKTGKDGSVEAQGLTFLEAMVARTPVVASRVGGIVDSVIDGETGILVDEGSPDQIAAAVLRIASDNQFRSDLANAGYIHATEYFSRSVSAAAFSELFSRLCTR